ncbi:MAG: hypothetical protein NZ534_11740, partial [Bacteroidia bacterium]|nr:hypothetical protein [Bacteroidia bacterium]
WLEGLAQNLEKYFQIVVVEAKAHAYNVNLKLARGKETLNCHVYFNGRHKITSVTIKEYSCRNLFADLKKMLIGIA